MAVYHDGEIDGTRPEFNINPLGVDINLINILEISSKLILIVLIFPKPLSD